MSAMVEAREPGARYSSALKPPLVQHFELMATAPGGVAKLRELILTLAVQGKLVPQDPSDAPATDLQRSIQEEKNRLIAIKPFKRERDEPELTEDVLPFDLPASWTWTALGTVTDIVRGITFPASHKTKEAAPGRIACLRTSNVQQTIEWDDLLFVDRSFMGREDQLIQHHDIVMSMANSRELVGKVALIDHIPHPEATFGGFLGVLRPRMIDPRYAMAVLRTPYAREMLIDSSSQTTNIANVSLAKLRPLPFPLPPAAEQARIVARVEELMRLCDALEAKGQLEAVQHSQLLQTLLGALTASTSPEELADNWQRVATHFDSLLDRPEAIDALEQTILQLAVRGLLVPQDPKEEPASELLKKIRADKDRLIAEGEIKRDKPLPPIEVAEHPFDLPSGWEWARLNDLIRIRSGDGLTTAQMDPNGQIPVFGGNGVNGHHNRSNVEEPTLVVGRVGYYCGSVHITPSRAWVTDNAFITRYPKALLDMNWLYWLLVGTNLKENDAATAQPVISGRKLYPIVVAVPPIGEQLRIVARVESLRRLCADLRQRLAARQTTQAHLAEALIDQVA